MPKEKISKTDEMLIEYLQAFLKSYEYGCHMLDGLVQRYLSGEDIIPQISMLYHNEAARSILFLITCSDKRAEEILSTNIIDEDGRGKLSVIRSKYRPILEDVIRVSFATAQGEINPVSACRLGLSYDHDDETLRIDITGYSGQREIFRVVQDASNFLGFAIYIIQAYSDSFESCEEKGLSLSEADINQLDKLQKELQNSSAKLSSAVRNYSNKKRQAEKA
jgi:hypothetical protein